MHVPRKNVERCCNQPQDSRKNKRRPHRLARRKPHNQQQGRNREASAADSGEPDGQSDHKAQEQVHHCERSEKV